MPRARFLLVFLGAASLAQAANTVTTEQLADPVTLGKNIGKSSAAGGTALSDPTYSTYVGGGASAVTGNSPARGSMGVTTTKTLTATLRCGATVYAGGLGIKAESCAQNNAGVVESVTVLGCTKGLVGGVCRTTDFTSAQIAPVGSTAVFGEFQVTVGQCGAASCPITVVHDAKLSYAGSALANDTANVRATDDGNSAVGSITATYQNGAYNAQMSQTGGEFKSCFDNTRASADSGQVTSCDGAQTAVVGTVDAPADCEDVQQCIQYVETSNIWTEKCQRSVSIVGQTCTKEDGDITCSVKSDPVEKGCTDTTTVKVKAETNCAPGTWFDVGTATLTGLYSGNGYYTGTKSLTVQAKCEPYRTDGKIALRIDEPTLCNGSFTEVEMSVSPVSESEGTLLYRAAKEGCADGDLWAIPSPGCADGDCTYLFVSARRYGYDLEPEEGDQFPLYKLNTSGMVFEPAYSCPGGLLGYAVPTYDWTAWDGETGYTRPMTGLVTECWTPTTDPIYTVSSCNGFLGETLLLFGWGWCTPKPGYNAGLVGGLWQGFKVTTAPENGTFMLDPDYSVNAQMKDDSLFVLVLTAPVSSAVTFAQPRTVYTEEESVVGDCTALEGTMK